MIGPVSSQDYQSVGGTAPNPQVSPASPTPQSTTPAPQPPLSQPATGFSVSNPTPIDANSVIASHDTTQDFSNSDYLQQAQDQVQNTYNDLQNKQADYAGLSQKYQNFANNQQNSDVNFYNNQLSTQGLTGQGGLFEQQANLQGQIASLDATINGVLSDVRQQFNGNAPESLIQATATTRTDLLNKQKATLQAQLDTINAQVTQRTNIADKLLSANETDQQHQLDTLSAQTGIAKDDLSTGLQLYRDAVSSFNNDRSAARQATIQIISQSPFAANALAANPQAMQDVQNGIISPAVLGIIGTTYKAQQAQDRITQLQIAQERANTAAANAGLASGQGPVDSNGNSAQGVVDSLISTDPSTWTQDQWTKNRSVFVDNFGEKAAKNYFDTSIKQPTTAKAKVNQPGAWSRLGHALGKFFSGN